MAFEDSVWEQQEQDALYSLKKREPGAKGAQRQVQGCDCTNKGPIP